MKKYEEAYSDYKNGATYKEIAKKYGVTEKTVNTWCTRYNWVRNYSLECDEVKNKIKEDLMEQLRANNIKGKHFEDLISDYMSLYDIKTDLDKDIKNRGCMVYWTKGRDSGFKKNESIELFNKVNTQMLKILSELKLKPAEIVTTGDDDDEI